MKKLCLRYRRTKHALTLLTFCLITWMLFTLFRQDIGNQIYVSINSDDAAYDAKQPFYKTAKDSEHVHKIVKRNTGNKLSMVLFSSWTTNDEKTRVYNNTLENWQTFLPDIQPLVFANDVRVQAAATERKWHHLPEQFDPRCAGPPLLPPMFINASDYYDSYFYGFANADILFSDNLIHTLDFFIKQWHRWKQPLMIIGRRTNYDFYKHKNFFISKREVVDKVNELEEVPKSTDYFFATRDFPWWKVPPLSIGRPAFCRWIMGYAHKIGTHVIDATATVAALHLTTEDGNKSSWNLAGNGMHCNEDVIEQRELTESVRLGLGWVECAVLETFLDDDNQVQLRPRNATDENCAEPY